MASETPEVGDKASWDWNGSTLSGEVAEKKDEGGVSIQSKRGNTIKKAAKPDDPAIHLARTGNDVVKNQSELQVEEKKAIGESSANRASTPALTGDEEEATAIASPSKKRKATAEPEGEGERAKKPKRQRGRPKKAKEPKAKAAKPAPAADGEKKKAGRPKKDPNAPSAPKKKRKAAAKPVGVGKRTRSQGN